VLIDLPQVVDVVSNPSGADFLARDVRNIASWFSVRGLPGDVLDVTRLTVDLQKAAGLT
jgi:RIO kinase 1